MPAAAILPVHKTSNFGILLGPNVEAGAKYVVNSTPRHRDSVYRPVPQHGVCNAPDLGRVVLAGEHETQHLRIIENRLGAFAIVFRPSG